MFCKTALQLKQSKKCLVIFKQTQLYAAYIKLSQIFSTIFLQGCLAVGSDYKRYNDVYDTWVHKYRVLLGRIDSRVSFINQV